LRIDARQNQRECTLDRLTLERRQVWIYLSAIIGGLLVGNAWPGITHHFEMLLWPALVLLLYATFLQVPLLHLRASLNENSLLFNALLLKLS
jgi:arsenite transporter